MTRAATKQAGGFSTASGLVVVVAALNLVGLVMILSASSVLGARSYGSAWHFVARQAMWTSLGVAALLVGSRVDHRHLRRVAVPGVVASAVLLVLVLVPGVGTTVAGSTRWLDFGPLRLQPSEVAKMALAVFCAHLLARREHRLADWRAGFLPLALVTGSLVGLVMLQPDMGTSSCFVLVAAGCAFASGIPGRHLVRSAGAILVAGVFAGWVEPYRRARMLSFRDPFDQASGDGYQLAQSLMGLGSGGIRGVGFGQSRVKWGFLPNAHTDFIFAIIGEEGGLPGTLFVVGLFVALAWLGVRTGLRAPDRFGTLLAAGITTWLVGQAVINMCTVIGMAPVTGVPMPFVSFGGSALVISMLAAGVLVNIAQLGEREAQAQAEDHRRSRPDRAAPAAPAADILPLRRRQPAHLRNAAAPARSPSRPR